MKSEETFIFYLMEFHPCYTAEDFTASLSVSDYIARFRDVERIGNYCIACPQLRPQLGVSAIPIRCRGILCGIYFRIARRHKNHPARSQSSDLGFNDVDPRRTYPARTAATRNGTPIRRTSVSLGRKLSLLPEGNLHAH